LQQPFLQREVLNDPLLITPNFSVFLVEIFA